MTGRMCLGIVLAAVLPLQQAIDERSAAGGGVVSVPPGEYELKPFELKNGVTLRLEKGAVLKASTNICDYPVRDGSPVLIGAYDATNVKLRLKPGATDARPCTVTDDAFVRQQE